MEVTEEDGVMVFKKPVESVEEAIFYSKEYFDRIGFSDAVVDVIEEKKGEKKVEDEEEKDDEEDKEKDEEEEEEEKKDEEEEEEKKEGEEEEKKDGEVKGGYYKDTANITVPFKQFVLAVQGEREEVKAVSKVEAKEEITPSNSDNKPGLLERFGKYNEWLSGNIKNGIDKIRPYLKGVQLVVNEESKVKFWVVKIPIIKDNLVKRNQFDIAEAKVLQTIKEECVDKSLGKSKVGKIYEVGDRYIRMCEGVKEWEPYEIEDVQLPGTIMAKMVSLNKR